MTRLVTGGALLLLLAGGGLLLSAGAYSSRTGGESVIGVDDAYITFRYAQHLVEGHGPVFNVGERVEGYSNPVFLLLVASGIAIVSPDAAYLWSVGLNAIFLSVTILILGGAVRRVAGPASGAAAAVACAACPVLWAWMGAGLESAQVLCVQTALWALAIQPASARRDWGLAALSVILVFSRPDGFIVPVVIAMHAWWSGRSITARRVLGAVLAGTTAISLWRLGYYGDLLPNTYYVKVAGPLLERLIAGGRQLIAVAGNAGLLPLMALLAMVGLHPWLRGPVTRLPAPPLSAALGGTLILYWLYLGGDVFDERFLLLLYPLGIYEAFRLATYVPRLPAWLVAGALVLVVAAPLGGRADHRFQFVRAKYDMWITLGHVLGQQHPDAVLAIDGAGKVPYVSGLTTIDMLGLNDRHLARLPAASGMVGHQKYSPDYVLSRRPDLIAAWVASPGFDLLWGLSRDRWEAAGYRLRYLVNASRFSQTDDSGRPADVIDVSTVSETEALRLLGRQYRYAVLVRNGG